MVETVHTCLIAVNLDARQQLGLSLVGTHDVGKLEKALVESLQSRRRVEDTVAERRSSQGRIQHQSRQQEKQEDHTHVLVPCFLATSRARSEVSVCFGRAAQS